MKALATALLALTAASLGHASSPLIDTSAATPAPGAPAAVAVPAEFASRRAAGNVNLVIDGKSAALAMMKAESARSAERGVIELVDAAFAPAGQLARLACEGTTLHESRSHRVSLLVGRYQGNPSTQPGWMARVAVAW